MPRPIPLRRRAAALLLGALLLAAAGAVLAPARRPATAAPLPTLYWGSSGDAVRLAQQRLASWGYYHGPIDGYYGASTWEAVRLFQSRNGLPVDGTVGARTWAALGYSAQPAAATPAYSPAAAVGSLRSGNVDLLARLVMAEAHGEPFTGQVAVAAVILNRMRNPAFPNTVAGVIFQPDAFESVSNGLIWQVTPDATAYQAAEDALNGWDPTYGSLYFWNPAKAVSGWIWTRPIALTIGHHVFAH
ncbi:MAG: spore cortex-lytic enzyme [Clostridia bacterium]|nr:spore cortex-lytic enzyme [Clostridia bacterium]